MLIPGVCPAESSEEVRKELGLAALEPIPLDLAHKVARVTGVIIAGKKSVERRHYLNSLPPDADKILHAVRTHWEVENLLHWCLDVQFADDCARARTGYVAHTLALVRHTALNPIRLNTSAQGQH